METNKTNYPFETMDLVTTGSLNDVVQENEYLTIANSLEGDIMGFKKIYQDFEVEEASEKFALLIQKAKTFLLKVVDTDPLYCKKIVQDIKTLEEEMVEIGKIYLQASEILLEVYIALCMGSLLGEVSKKNISEDLVKTVYSENPKKYLMSYFNDRLDPKRKMYLSIEKSLDDGDGSLEIAIKNLKSMIR